MSLLDLRPLAPSIAAMLALSGCASEPLPPPPTPLPPSVAIVAKTSTETRTLWSFHGQLLSPPLDGKGPTAIENVVLTCALTDTVDKRGITSKRFEACGVPNHEPPLFPLARREFCDQANHGLVGMGQLSLKENTGAIHIFTTPSDMTLLEPYSRCGEFTGSKAQAPHRSIYEGRARGRASRRGK